MVTVNKNLIIIETGRFAIGYKKKIVALLQGFTSYLTPFTPKLNRVGKVRFLS